jgi:hypothetical protein
MFFLTSYANINGELMHFKLYDSATGTVQNLNETMYFTADIHQGSIESPVPFTLPLSGTVEEKTIQTFDIQPNPFNSETSFRFVLPASEEILLNITDMNGREVARLQTQAHGGLNVVNWSGISDDGVRLTAGVYFVRLKSSAGIITRKVVLQR